jgi:hypothetical protein
VDEPQGGALQFDRADFEQPTSARCTFCQAPIQASYFEVNGQVACPGCRTQIEEAMSGGSGVGRFVRATVLGTVAAVIGSGLYYAVRAVTGWEIGLIAIVVGLLVGAAVKTGSNRRGGWVYQGLAMFLTYAAIVSTYIPAIREGIRQAKVEQTARTPHATTPGAAPSAADPSPATVSAPAASEVAAPPNPVSSLPHPVRVALGFVLLFVLACFAPFLMGFRNIMGLIIIGIGLYEAWKINKRVPVAITGPYRLSAATAPSAGD